MWGYWGGFEGQLEVRQVVSGQVQLGSHVPRGVVEFWRGGGLQGMGGVVLGYYGWVQLDAVLNENI